MLYTLETMAGYCNEDQNEERLKRRASLQFSHRTIAHINKDCQENGALHIFSPVCPVESSSDTPTDGMAMRSTFEHSAARGVQ